MNGIGQRILLFYSVILTSITAIVILAGFTGHKPTSFDEVTVHRINVVEPDGALRMVISNHTELPGVIVRGNEQKPLDRPQAGMLFYNDEGSEIGGLIFGGRRNERRNRGFRR